MYQSKIVYNILLYHSSSILNFILVQVLPLVGLAVIGLQGTLGSELPASLTARTRYSYSYNPVKKILQYLNLRLTLDKSFLIHQHISFFCCLVSCSILYLSEVWIIVKIVISSEHVTQVCTLISDIYIHCIYWYQRILYEDHTFTSPLLIGVHLLDLGSFLSTI